MGRRRALVAVNARSRSGGADFASFVAELRGAGLEVLALRLTDSAEVEAAIREHADLVDLVVVGGGDGTMNAAAEALIAAGRPCGVLPLGTANDLARDLGIPRDPRAAARVILDDRRRRIDLGRANDKLFFNVATVGLSARLAKAMDGGATERPFGALAHALTVARIGLGQSFEATIRTPHERCRVRAIQIAVGNGRRHGGAADEGAAVDDQLLHLRALEPHDPWDLVRKLPWLPRPGRHEAPKGVVSLAASTIEVLTDRKLPLTTDGEATTHTPARFTVLPKALEVFAPPLPSPP